ncbi:LysR family transcriptional regulator [Endozoicomonas sp. SM1973]|uniref:LysR family transcriptional regulator n=1 Tax=Spartinivicinus marinus TaxID=2994442 RepID=A0A853I1P7_9GAMM|nr:LysR family transcriptional regulator [Spartinivicinus marinus]NYZ65372.1 LysR family transcriptional regulator [Spartinivicinus marinus]
MVTAIPYMMTFIEVVEKQSFSRAAGKLDLSAAAVSIQMKKLEQELGFSLLQRSTRTLKLTEQGARFYDHCKELQALLAVTESFADRVHQEPEGKLRVVSSIYTGHRYLIEHLSEFYKRYPKIQLDVEISDRIPDFSRQEVDILVGFSNRYKELPGDLYCRRLLSVSALFSASPTYLKKFGTPKSIGDLKNHEFIYHKTRSPQQTLKFFADIETIIPPAKITFNSVDAVISAGLQGLGIIDCPELICRPYLKSGRLIPLFVDIFSKKMEGYLFYDKKNVMLPKFRAFIDFMIEKTKHLREN